MIVVSSTPLLVENTTVTSMRTILQKCHENRIRIYSIIFNIIVVFIFCGIFGLGLYYCRYKKLSPLEQKLKFEKSKSYILSKIREYQQTKLNNWSISNLPDIYAPVAQQID